MLNLPQTPQFCQTDVSGSALVLGDCLEVMKYIPSKSVQLILADLPYGTTACKWDSIIPLEPLWEQYKRIIKDNGAIVLTASQPFTTKLISSNYEMFKYEWIWEKAVGSNFATAKYQPLKEHENIVVFAKGKITYNPIKEEKTKGGIIIPDTAKEKPQKGTAIAVGSGKKDEPMTVKVGDSVLYGKYAGTEIEIEGKSYLIMRESDVLAVV